MKLSEAIMLGSVLGRQAFGVTRDGDGGACAFGAALQAVGKSGEYIEAFRIWPWVSGEATCPISGRVLMPLSIIRQLNDYERWPRERIASWVASIEPKEFQEVQPVVTEEQTVNA